MRKINFMLSRLKLKTSFDSDLILISNSLISTLNLMAICDQRHANVSKQTMLLARIDNEASAPNSAA